MRRQLRLRPLQLALLASVLLHGVLLWSARTSDGGGAAPLLHGHLQPAPMVPAADDSGMKPTLGLRSPAAKEVLPPQRERSASQTHSSSAANVSVTGPQALPAVTTQAPTQVLPTEGAGLDAGGLRLYRMGLAMGLGTGDELKRSATPGGQQKLTVRVNVATGGLVLGVELARGSGNARLDEAGVTMVRRAAQAATVPSVLHGQSFAVELPIEVDG